MNEVQRVSIREADFDLGAMLAQSGLNAVAVERVNIPRLWRLVTCVK